MSFGFLGSRGFGEDFAGCPGDDPLITNPDSPLQYFLVANDDCDRAWISYLQLFQSINISLTALTLIPGPGIGIVLDPTGDPGRSADPAIFVMNSNWGTGAAGTTENLPLILSGAFLANGTSPSPAFRSGDCTYKMPSYQGQPDGC